MGVSQLSHEVSVWVRFSRAVHQSPPQAHARAQSRTRKCLLLWGPPPVFIFLSLVEVTRLSLLLGSASILQGCRRFLWGIVVPVGFGETSTPAPVWGSRVWSWAGEGSETSVPACLRSGLDALSKNHIQSGGDLHLLY